MSFNIIPGNAATGSFSVTTRTAPSCPAKKMEYSKWVQDKKNSVQIFNFQDSEPPPRDDVIDV